MTSAQASALYSVANGITSNVDSLPVLSLVNPVSANNEYKQGKVWINQLTNTVFMLTSFSTSTGQLLATWTQLS